MKEQVLKFIETIRESFSDAVKVYTSGSCYKFYLILKEVFPEAICYYDISHVITRIGDNYYDITGEVENTNHFPVEEDLLVHERIKQCKYTGLV